jgi:hypothetical protein
MVSSMLKFKRKIHDEDLFLLTLEEYAMIPDGTLLLCVDGGHHVKNDPSNYYEITQSNINEVTPLGLTKTMFEEQNLNNLFLFFKMRESNGKNLI